MAFVWDMFCMVLGFFHRRLMGFCCRISILNSTQKVRAILAATYTQYDFIRKIAQNLR